jgi:S1-C subfamily serine protease
MPEFRREGSGSGLVWDREGHIITNNHVVQGGGEITVTFSDGTSTSAEVIGQDADSDLAVIHVDVAPELLEPIEVADSTQVQVGDIAIAIGNPFGLQGSMTVGVISALGRSLPVGVDLFTGPTYTIPDVIQTDAPINPGNSGGALVNIRGELIGVTTAIESPVRANAGIGFVIPSVIVEKVVPELIETGEYQHPVIGISGRTLDSQTAEQMGLEDDQRGALVLDVTPNSPADKADLQGSDRIGSVNGAEIRMGGDVITAINGQPLDDFEDLVAFLARYTEVGETVTLTVIREGEVEEVEVTLAAREGLGTGELRTAEAQAGAWLGISGITLFPEAAREMGLEADQVGALVQEVFEDSPADQAGLQGSFMSLGGNGEQVLIGGDVIVAVGDEEIASMLDLQNAIRAHRPGDEISLTVLRDGREESVAVTLGERPDS